MIGTRQLEDSRTVRKDVTEGWVIVVGAGEQILGGGYISEVKKKGGAEVREISAAWAISDLTVDHWEPLLGNPDVVLVGVGQIVAVAAKKTIDRLFQASVQRARQEQDRRSGVEDAVRVITQVLTETQIPPLQSTQFRVK